ncbi:hypothetical protein AB3X55_09030 [Alphaproteobacteria bacterium LSUCC0719]
MMGLLTSTDPITIQLPHFAASLSLNLTHLLCDFCDGTSIVSCTSLECIEEEFVTTGHRPAGKFMQHLSTRDIDTPRLIEIMLFESTFELRAKLSELRQKVILV